MKNLLTIGLVGLGAFALYNYMQKQKGATVVATNGNGGISEKDMEAAELQEEGESPLVDQTVTGSGAKGSGSGKMSSFVDGWDSTPVSYGM